MIKNLSLKKSLINNEPKLNKKKLNKAPPSQKTLLIFVGIFFTVYTLSTLVPIIWGVLSSFKDSYDFIMEPSPIPQAWHFSNYPIAFKKLEIQLYNKAVGAYIKYNIFNMFGYSFLISAISSVLGVVHPVLMAYVLTKYNFPGKKFLIQLNIVVMILPIVGSLPSALQLRSALGLYDNLFPFMLTSGSPFGMSLLIFMAFMRGLPNEYKEAAVVDGAGNMKIFLQIYIPLLVPIITAKIMLGFIGKWNDYMTNIIWLPSYPNLAYGVFMFQQTSYALEVTRPQILAAFVIVSIPSITLWALTQGIVSKHMVVGGLKG